MEADYHDQEWGVPLFDDNKLFEFFLLVVVHAGLSWVTVLRKRTAYRKAYEGFIPETVAQYSPQKIDSLLKNPELIRNRLKIEASVKNARAFLIIQETFGSFSNYYWRFSEGQPIDNHWESAAAVPAQTEQSIALSKDLKKRNFSFVGPTICYAFMQATGMVNDHTTDCFRHAELLALKTR